MIKEVVFKYDKRKILTYCLKYKKNKEYRCKNDKN